MWKNRDLVDKVRERFCEADAKCKLLEEQLTKAMDELKVARKEREEHRQANAEAKASLAVAKVAILDL